VQVLLLEDELVGEAVVQLEFFQVESLNLYVVFQRILRVADLAAASLD